MELKPTINKFFEREAKIPSILIELNIPNIDSDYFIKKIDNLIDKKYNLNQSTNVFGGMTDWNAFLDDKKLQEIFHKSFMELKDYKNLGRVTVDEAWGIRMNEGDFTFEHDHGTTGFSGVLYLTDSDQKLVFKEMGIKVKPKKGLMIIFDSYLKHGTEFAVREQKTKYGIAFNCKLFEWFLSA